jgi:uncharacterized flavoprotein (TIGR03862 family)
MAAYRLADAGFKVTVFDHKKSFSRKLLVAGKGGFNLTHGEPIEMLVKRYNAPIIQHAVREFTNQDFREFLNVLGIETFIGSSGRVFPTKCFTPAEVVRRWQESIKKRGGIFLNQHSLSDFQDKTLIFETPSGKKYIESDYVIMALGGASWTKTGSDGKWVKLLANKGIKIVPFKSSNSGVVLNSTLFDKSWSGSPLKNIAIYSDECYRKGELVWTNYGLEGTPVYSMNFAVRERKELYIDFKPDLTEEQIRSKWQRDEGSTKQLRCMKISREAIAFLKMNMKKEQFTDVDSLIPLLKKFKLPIEGLREMEEAISTVGGIAMEEVNSGFQLTKLANYIAVGEMLDWDTRTGGYLIQAAVSSGNMAANVLINSCRSGVDLPAL